MPKVGLPNFQGLLIIFIVMENKDYNQKSFLVASLVVVVVLGVVMLVMHDKAKKIEADLTAKNSNLTESLGKTKVELSTTKTNLSEQVVVNNALETTLSNRVTEIKSLSADLTKTVATLTATTTELNTTKVDLKKIEEQSAKALAAATEAAAKAKAESAKAKAENDDQKAKITALQTQQDDMTKRITGLQKDIGDRESLIASTEKKLAASEGDRSFLLRELKRLQTEKADLERQMNDLEVMRAQYTKLKSEMAIRMRERWQSLGFFEEKRGAQILKEGVSRSAPKPAVKPASKLNVELKKDGSVSVTPGSEPDGTPAPPVPPKK